MNITPEEKTIQSLLSSQKEFIIPRFQREYSWEEKQYKEFFEDILNELSIVDNKVVPSQYFLGTMVFVGDFSDSSYKEMQVVDGQQRLTTITILFSAIADIFNELGEINLQQSIFKYIMFIDDNAELKRVLKTNTSYPFFADYIQRINKGVKTEPNTDEELLIYETYSYFKDYLSKEKLYKKLIEKKQDKGIKDIYYLDILKAIRDQVLGCQLVTITTKNKSDSYKLFEILNAKGMNLAYIDLIKNTIFESLSAEEPSDFAYDKWKEMKEILNSGLNTVSVATFFQHYWMSKYGKFSKVRLYDSFTKKIKKDEYETFLEELCINADYYMQCASPKRETYKNKKEYFDLVQSLSNINLFGVTQPRIAILSLFDAKARGVINAVK